MHESASQSLHKLTCNYTATQHSKNKRREDIVEPSIKFEFVTDFAVMYKLKCKIMETMMRIVRQAQHNHIIIKTVL